MHKSRGFQICVRDSIVSISHPIIKSHGIRILVIDTYVKDFESAFSPIECQIGGKYSPIIQGNFAKK